MPISSAPMTLEKPMRVSRYAATMPPVPKNADWPNDNRPVKPNSRSKPRPNRPHTRIRLTVSGDAPSGPRMNGATIRPMAVRSSTRSGRSLSMSDCRLFAAGSAEQAVGPEHQHEGHGHEQHDIRIARIEH